MKKLLILLLLSFMSAQSFAALCPNGSYVNGNRCKMCPNGTYVGGNTCTLAPNGQYVGGSPRLCPDGTYVGGGKCTLCPDGTYAAGHCTLHPNGTYGNSSSFPNANKTGAGRGTVNASYNAGSNVAAALISIFESLLGTTSSNTQTNNNSVNSRYYDFGETYNFQGNKISGTDGLECEAATYSHTCNNGVTYRVCGDKVCGSDGTKYWYSVMTPTYTCVASCFGSHCCGAKGKEKICDPQKPSQ